MYQHPFKEIHCWTQWSERCSCMLEVFGLIPVCVISKIITVSINFSHSDWIIARKYQAVFSKLQSALLMIKRLGDNNHVRV